jgi:hypothetical protein
MRITIEDNIGHHRSNNTDWRQCNITTGDFKKSGNWQTIFVHNMGVGILAAGVFVSFLERCFADLTES